MAKVLLVDDDLTTLQVVSELLRQEGHEVFPFSNGNAAIAGLTAHAPDLVITDLYFDKTRAQGLEVVEKARALSPPAEVIVITGFGTIETALRATKLGAYDYLEKPFKVEELKLCVQRTLSYSAARNETVHLRRQLKKKYGFDQIVGSAPKMVEVFKMIERVANTDSTILVLGESGTGKELVAGALHSLSQRSGAAYVRINCAAIPEALLESELFGHEKGAFTGALKQKPGRVEEADGGTIFLDEIADMSRPLQAKLLRFLEDGSFLRVGGTAELRVNVRLIAATNRDIVEAIRQGQFREDLFHRLNVVQFRLPPLRERGEDVLLLADYFLQAFNEALHKKTRAISRAARQKLQAHHWPGNVRELRNVIERALILETTPEIQAASLPDFQLEGRLHKKAAPRLTGSESLDDRMADFERELITAMLEQNHYSLTRTAEQLKVSRHALRYRMQRLNITTGTDAEEDSSAAPGKAP